MTAPKPLLSDREIADQSASFTANLPILKRSGWTTSDHRCGMELARTIYESDRAALLAEIERLKAAVQPLGGIINALHSYRTEWASPVPDPDWQMKLRKRLFSQWDKSQPITLPEKGSE